MAEERYEVRWEDKSCALESGSTFLDVKKAFGWKNDVLMVGEGDEARELRARVTGSCDVVPLTFQDERARWALRHTAAHILAQAVKRLRPDAKLAIGPAIEDGFYYDFDVKTPFTPDDLEKIEAEMKKIVSENLPVLREEVDREKARKLFRDQGETYKEELLEELPEGEPISLYRQGEFVDLCAGPTWPPRGW